MAIVDQALWIVERNSSRPLNLNSIAAACGVSRSHLANAFGTATGWPMMKYLKARRLTEAAYKLADGAPDILSVALYFGYGSHEAFTRAFRDHFGQTPEQVRNRRNLDGLAVTPPLRLRRAPARSPVPQLRTLGRLKLAGLPMLCSYNETIQIPAQWQRFMAAFYENIPRKLEQMPIGMCEPPDDDGCFKYVCAAQVEAFGEKTDQLTYVEVEARTYAVYAHDDHASTIFDTYSEIWNEALPALARRVANGPVLEFHRDGFDPDTGLGGLEIWIPLED